jgi:hypothetical protein
LATVKDYFQLFSDWPNQATFRRFGRGRLAFSLAAAVFASLLTLPPFLPSATACGFFLLMGLDFIETLRYCQAHGKSTDRY